MNLIKKVRLVVVMALVAGSSHAGGKYFTYAAATNTWDATSFYWGDVSGGPYDKTWVANDDATFEGTAGTVTLSGGQAANRLTFATAGYTLTGNTLTLGGATPVISNSVSATVNSVIAGTGGITKSGAGTLTLGGANTCSGGITLSAGTLMSGTMGALGTGVVTLGDANTQGGDVMLYYTANNTSATNVFVSTNGSGNAVIKWAQDVWGSASRAYNTASDMKWTLNRLTTFQSANGGAQLSGLISGGAGPGNVTLKISGGVNVIYTVGRTTSAVSLNDFTGNVWVTENTILVAQNRAYENGAYVNGIIPDQTTVIVDAGSEWRMTWGEEAAGFLSGAGAVSWGGGGGNAILTLAGSSTTPTTNASVVGIADFGGIIGGLNLIKSGSGTQILSGANTYAGATTISGGMLQIGNGGVSGALGTGPVTDNAMLVFKRSDSTTYGGAISGAGVVSQEGSGTLVMTGAITHTGGTTINAGILQIGAGGGAGSITGSITNNTALVFNRSGSSTYGGVLSGTGTVAKVGVGTLTLKGASTTGSPLTVNEGAVALGAGGQWNGPVQVNGGAALVGAGTLAQPVVVANGGALSPGSAATGGTLAFNDLTMGNGTNVFFIYSTNSVSSNGLVTVSGNWTNSNAVIAVVPLQLQLPNGDYPLFAYTNTWVGTGFNPTVLGNNSRSVWTLTNFSNGVYLHVDSYIAHLKWDPAAPGNWDVQVSSNWLDGAVKSVFYNGDNVAFDNTGAAMVPTVILGSAVTPASITVSNTAPYTFTGAGVLSCPIPLLKTGSGTLTFTDMPNIACAVALSNGVVVFNTVATNQTYSQNLTGPAGAIIKSGSGTLNLGGANSYGGNTTISQGTLAANHVSALGMTTGSLILGDINTGVNAVEFKFDAGVAGTMTLNSITTSSQGTAQTVTINGANGQLVLTTLNLSGSVPLTIRATNTGGRGIPQDVSYRIAGSGVAAGNTALTLDGSVFPLRTSFNNGAAANNFSGDVVIKGSVNTQNLSYNGNTAANQNLGFLSNSVTVFTGATWQLVWGGETIGALNGTGNVNLNNQSALNNIGFTIGNNNANGSYSGVISGGFGVAKVGGGTQTFFSANTYAGGTTVKAGTLLLDNATGSGTGSGVLNINSNATLCGTGKVAGVTMVAATGCLAPGDPGVNGGIGVFTVSNSVLLASDSTLVVQVATGGGDRLLSVGTATITGAKLAVSALDDTITVGSRFVLLAATNIVGAFSGYADGAGVTVGSRRMVVSYPGATNVVLEVKSTGFMLLIQ